MSDFEAIRFSVADNVATITLDRPDAGNAMNHALARELAVAAARCDGDPSVKAVLLTGNGKLFSAGGDLKAMVGFGADVAPQVKILADDLHKAISTFSRMAAPLVIAVNGAAAGAGFSLAISGDYVIAARTAKFTMAYTAAGLTPDGSSSWFLPRLIGLRRAQELAFTNRTLTAEEAVDWGMITRVVDDAQLLDEAKAICAMFADGSLSAHAGVKRLLLASSGNGLETQTELEGRGISQATATPDGQEGIAAFSARRKPVFAR